MSEPPPTVAAPPALGGPVHAQPASATEALYRAALGPAGLDHYLPVFARFDELGVSHTHWNPAAAALGWHWMLYRRLWRAALLHPLLLALAIAVWWWLPQLTGPWPAGVRWGLLAAIGVLAVVVPGWWGDAWLHADVRRRMTAAVRRARTVQEACTLLARPSPLRRVWQLVLLLELGALAAWGLHWPGAASAPPTPEPVVGESGRAPVAVPPVVPSVVALVPAMPVVAPAPATPAAAEPVALPTAAVTPAPASTPSPAAPAASPAIDAPPPPDLRPRLGGHGVAVGMFADPANAERVARRLRDAGLPVVSDPVESSRGTLVRVRVGPYGSAEEASAAAEAVRQLGLDAKPYGPR